MNVRYIGFSIENQNAEISTDDVFKFIKDQNGTQLERNKSTRVFYINDDHNDKYILGIAITIKDQKKFCRLQAEGTKLKIKVENLKDKDKLMDFNFFMINKNNGIGLYQYYHQSFSVNSFGECLIYYSRQLSNNKVNNEAENYKIKYDKDIPDNKLKAIRKKYHGKTILRQLVRKEKLLEILLEHKKIKSFEYEYETLTPETKKGVPISKFVKKKREKLTFDQKFKVPALANAINGAIKTINPDYGRVAVQDNDGVDRFVKIFNMPDYFGEDDFDEIATYLEDLDVDKFHQNEVIDRLINIFESDRYDHIFQAEIA